jgi:hypothetical protein
VKLATWWAEGLYRIAVEEKTKIRNTRSRFEISITGLSTKLERMKRPDRARDTRERGV